MKEKLKKIGLGYRDFINRGNIIELAVGLVIGMLFNEIVKKFIEAFLTPVIVLATGKTKLADLSFTIISVNFPYGEFIQAIVNFLIVSLVLYLIFVKIINEKIKQIKTKKDKEAKVEDVNSLLIKQNELLTLLVKQQIPNYEEELKKLQNKNGITKD